MKHPYAVLAAALLASCLSACGDDDPEPQFAPPPSTAPTSPAPSTVPSSPATSTPPPHLSPEDTVRAWVDASNHLLVTGDATAVEALSATRCDTCFTLIDPVKKQYAAGGHIETKGWIVKGVGRDKHFSRRHNVVAAVDFRPGVSTSRTGANPMPFPDDKNVLKFTLRQEADTWLVSQVIFLS